MDFKQHLREYAEKELKIIGFMDLEFGSACLEFLDKCADVACSDPESMKRICEIVPRLIDRHPLAPITGADFVEEIYNKNGHEFKIYRCQRYPSVYKDQDGNYWDDRAIAFRYANDDILSKTYLYQEKYNSKQQIVLPYFPDNKVVIIS